MISTYFSQVKFVIWNDFTIILNEDALIIVVLFSKNLLFSFRKENDWVRERGRKGGREARET